MLVKQDCCFCEESRSPGSYYCMKCLGSFYDVLVERLSRPGTEIERVERYLIKFHWLDSIGSLSGANTYMYLLSFLELEGARYVERKIELSEESWDGIRADLGSQGLYLVETEETWPGQPSLEG